MSRVGTPEYEPCHFRGHWRGSAVLLALLACLVASVAVQMLAAAVVCASRAAVDESIGRDALAARDECLVRLMEKAADDWGPTGATDFEVQGTTLSAGLSENNNGSEWVLTAEVPRQSNACVTTRALVERGRDGMDLPTAALVAGRVRLAPSRISPWLMSSGGTVSAYTQVALGEALVGGGCDLRNLDSAWSLEDGWRRSLAQLGARGERCLIIMSEPGQLVRAPETVADSSSEGPVLLVVMGGASLDLTDFGEIWGVVVVDEGSLAGEGTVVHGAVYVTRDVDLGMRGQVVYEDEVLGWARDRSLTRTRLTPGSRREVTE